MFVGSFYSQSSKSVKINGNVAKDVIHRTEKDGGCTFYHNSLQT